MSAEESIVRCAYESASSAARIPVSLLLSSARRADVVLARHVAWLVAHDIGASYSAIGRYARRTHDTVLRGVRSLRGRMDDPVVKDMAMRAMRIYLDEKPNAVIYCAAGIVADAVDIALEYLRMISEIADRRAVFLIAEEGRKRVGESINAAIAAIEKGRAAYENG